MDRKIPPQIQQALDYVRVIGNNAVHPGQIDTDDPQTAMALFSLVNMTADYAITKPTEVQELFDSLPEQSRKQIEHRNLKAIGP